MILGEMKAGLRSTYIFLFLDNANKISAMTGMISWHMMGDSKRRQEFLKEFLRKKILKYNYKQLGGGQEERKNQYGCTQKN